MTTWRPFVRAAAALGTAMVLAISAPSCSSDSTGSISDRTVPPVSLSGTDVEPTRTVPPLGTGPQSTVGRAGSAAITDFSISNKISCALGSIVSVTASYRTDGAAHVVFVLDGAEVHGSPPPSGSFDVDVPCDGNAHTLVLTAVDAAGRTTVMSKAILTNVPPTGD
jgi:hypothetical protein